MIKYLDKASSKLTEGEGRGGKRSRKINLEFCSQFDVVKVSDQNTKCKQTPGRLQQKKWMRNSENFYQLLIQIMPKL